VTGADRKELPQRGAEGKATGGGIWSDRVARAIRRAACRPNSSWAVIS